MHVISFNSTISSFIIITKSLFLYIARNKSIFTQKKMPLLQFILVTKTFKLILVMIPPIPILNSKIFEFFDPAAGKLLSPLLLIFMVFI